LAIEIGFEMGIRRFRIGESGPPSAYLNFQLNTEFLCPG
jgi:hypothetical protein